MDFINLLTTNGGTLMADNKCPDCGGELTQGTSHFDESGAPSAKEICTQCRGKYNKKSGEAKPLKN
jgi:hypothetical protein